MIDLLIQFGVPKQYAGDVWLLIIFIALGIALMYLVQRKRLGALLISVYLAFVISSFSFFIPNNSAFQAAYFVALSIAIFIFMKKFFNFSLGSGKFSEFLQSLVFTLLTLGMSTSFILNWVSPQELGEFFTPFSKQLFTSPLAHLAWATAPLAFIFLVKKHRY